MPADRHTFAFVVRKIVITGPESSGKTTLAKALAVHHDAGLVAEMARTYFAERPGTYAGYDEAELRSIAGLQVREEDRVVNNVARDGGGLVCCDTDLITIRIWGEEKFGRSDPWVVQQTMERPYDLWLLCRPDMPWEPDPLRENPNDRERLFEVYRSTLRTLEKPFIVLEGAHELRLRQAIAAIAQVRVIEG